MHIYHDDARMQCANRLLATVAPQMSTLSFKFGSHAHDWVATQVNRDLDLPSFKGQDAGTVYFNAVADVTQILRDSGRLHFNEPKLSCARDYATGYREGVETAQAKDINSNRQLIREVKNMVHEEFKTFNSRIDQDRKMHVDSLRTLHNEHVGRLQEIRTAIEKAVGGHTFWLGSSSVPSNNDVAAGCDDSFRSDNYLGYDDSFRSRSPLPNITCKLELGSPSCIKTVSLLSDDETRCRSNTSATSTPWSTNGEMRRGQTFFSAVESQVQFLANLIQLYLFGCVFFCMVLVCGFVGKW